MSESSEFRALWSFTQVNGFISNRAKTYGTYKGCLFSLQQLLTISRCTMALQLSVWHNGKKKQQRNAEKPTWHNSTFVARYMKVIFSFWKFLPDERYLLAGGADKYGCLSGSQRHDESKRIYGYEESGSVSDPNLSLCFCVPLKKAHLKSKRVRKGDHYKGWVALSWNYHAFGVLLNI